jgi:hypothetical protein
MVCYVYKNIKSYRIMLKAILNFFSCVKHNEKNINNHIIENLLVHHNKNKAILQGKYLRDNIGLENIINLFEKTINIDIIQYEWKFYEMFDNKKFIKSESIIKNLDIFLREKMQELEKNGFYVILLKIPFHVNLLCIDKRKKHKWKYYLYEPHMPEELSDNYEFIDCMNNFFKSYGYNIIDIPKNLLKQHELPLCYIYVLHSILCLYILNNNINIDYEIDCNNEMMSDTYIINFTEKILCLCYDNNMIDGLIFNFLTNNMAKIVKIKNRYIDYDILLLSCEPNIIINTFENNMNLHIIFNNIDELYDEDIDLKYFCKVINLVKNNNVITLHQKNDFYVLELILEFIYDVKFDVSLYNFYDENMFYNIIYNNDIIARYYDNYDFCVKIFSLMPDVYERKNIIEKYYASGKLCDIINKKCIDKRTIKFINKILNGNKKRTR